MTPSNDLSLIAVNVGNTRTSIGQFVEGELARTESRPNDDLAAVVEVVAACWADIAETPRAAIAVASVNDTVADRLVSAVQDQLGIDVYRVGVDLPVPIGTQLDRETITGVDRLLNAAAAYATVRQACVVVDAGTAVTVDFVDGAGTFQGGAIAPGAQLQLDALHEHTDALPEIRFQRPHDRTFGRSTTEAMLHGVMHGIRGMVWKLIERYAERYGAFPMVIATGGDSDTIFADDELVDRIVPDLTLHGIASAARAALAVDDDADVST
jgi:type III pantothenate kinase